MSSQSLQDQLRQAGLANEKQGKKSKWGKVSRESKKKKPQAAQPTAQTEAQQAAERALAEKAARTEALNRERQAEAQRKAMQAEIRQILTQNAVRLPDEGMAYHFSDHGVIHTLTVSKKIQQDLVAERCRIARLGDRYVVIPQSAVEKIRQRDESHLVPVPEATTDSDDDYYAQFTVPDDLIW